MKTFEDKNAQLVGLSSDSRPSLRAWAANMGGLRHPLLSDFWPHGAVAEAYGILNADSGMCARSLFIIDPEGIVRYKELYQGALPDPDAILGELARLQG